MKEKISFVQVVENFPQKNVEQLKEEIKKFSIQQAFEKTKDNPLFSTAHLAN